METNDYLRALRRYWRVILAATLIGGLAAAALGLATREQVVARYSVAPSAVLLTPSASAKLQTRLLQAEQYAAVNSLLVPVAANGAATLPTLFRVIVSDRVLAATAKELGSTVDDVRNRISVTVVPNSEILEVATTGPSETAARKLGIALMSAFAAEQAVLYPTGSTAVSMGISITKPQLSADSSRAEVEQETSRLVRVLISEDPTAAESIVAPVLELFDQSLAAELVSSLHLQADPADLFKALSVAAVVGPAEPTTGTPANTGEISISATASNPSDAAAIARGAAEILQQRVAVVTGGDSNVPSPLVLTTDSGNAVQSAIGEGNAVLVDLVLGLLIGFAAGVGYAFLRASRDHTIRSPRQLFTVTDAAPIAVVTTQPSDGAGRWAALSAGDASGGGYRSLRSNLLFGAPDLHVLTVTSPEAGDGKLTIAVNLAIALAQVGKSVVLIEADLRQPRLASALGLDSDRGLADVLANGTPISQALQTWAAGSMDVLAAGQPVSNPSELLSSPSYAAALAELRGTHDYVICLSGPILAGTEAAVVAKQSDGALVVVRLAKTTTTDLAAAATALIQVQSPVAGLIVADVPASQAIAWAVMAGPAPAEV